MSKWEGGKGSKRRPENDTTYQDNWEKIFGAKNLKLKSERRHQLTLKLKYKKTKQSTTERNLTDRER